MRNANRAAEGNADDGRTALSPHASAGRSELKMFRHTSPPRCTNSSPPNLPSLSDYPRRRRHDGDDTHENRATVCRNCPAQVTDPANRCDARRTQNRSTAVRPHVETDSLPRYTCFSRTERDPGVQRIRRFTEPKNARINQPPIPPPPTKPDLRS